MTRTISVKAGVAAAAVAALALGLFVQSAFADAAAITFESPTYTVGNINGQDGWQKTGSYDVAVTSSFGVPGFGSQSLRFSNAVTSGSFGDQTFSKSLADEAGEAVAENGGMSGGTRQAKFEASFDIRSMQLSQQPGLFLSVSPDRGDGARMSYLGFADTPDGIDVTFYDVQGTTDPANFVPTLVADNLSRATTHTAKFEIEFVNGPSNDVVKIYIDGNLVHTGTTWENYYRFDNESNPSAPSDTSRTVDSLLFRAGGTAAPATSGLGYLIDNVSLESSGAVPPPQDVTVTIIKYIDGAHATAGNADSTSFPMTSTWDATNIGAGAGSYALSTVGFNNPNAYEATTAAMSNGADYSTAETLTGPDVGASCNDGKPFALAGYSVGESEAAAAAAATTSSVALTDITTSKYIIVHNIACVDEPPVPPTPPANACETPTVAPAGFTLRNGSNSNDTVTLIPGTMFVGKNGNDTVTAPAGNYIVCLGNGNDKVTLGDGDSTIDVRNGANEVTVGNGTGTIKTGNGNDKIVAGDGARTITAGHGANNITTGAGAQNITTGNGDDTVDAGADTDTCSVGNGNNTLTSCEL